MSMRRLLLLALVAGVPAFGADAPPPTPTSTAAAPAKPWTETFTMTLRGKERTFVVHDANSYLMAAYDDLTTPAFLDQKDVMFNGKFGYIDGSHVRFYNLPKVEGYGPAELWQTHTEGDNLYVFGHMTLVDGALHLQVAAIANAPSDTQVINDRLATVPAEDLNARLVVAKWVREMAATQGNREFWLVAADNIVSQVVDDAAAQAETKKDVSVILQAMQWCQDLLNDIPRAARIGSAAWIREVGGSEVEEVAKRMRLWDLEFYKGEWRPRGEALTMEYNDRFTAITWRDAEAYYKLGRWADANAEVLPRARELSYRSYQAGFRANPNHNGIRRELAMEPVESSGDNTPLHGDFKDNPTGIVIINPTGWSRTDPINGDVTWIDPTSDTAYITAKVLREQDAVGDLPTLWAHQLAEMQEKVGFTVISDSKVSFTNGVAERMRCSYHEGRYVRQDEIILVVVPLIVAAGSPAAGQSAVCLRSSASDNEAEAVNKLFSLVVEKLVVPNVLPATTGAKEPAAKTDGATASPGAKPPTQVQPVTPTVPTAPSTPTPPPQPSGPTKPPPLKTGAGS